MDSCRLTNRKLNLLETFLPIVVIGLLFMLLPNKLHAQASSSQNQTATITIQSNQDSAMVFSDTTFQGFTPIHFVVPCNKLIIVSLTKRGFLTQRDTLQISECLDTILTVNLHMPATLIVSSEPDSAKVYKDSKYIGMTPLTLSDLPSDTLQLKVARAYHEPWITSFIPREGSTTQLTARLQSRQTTINVFANRPDVSISIDDRFISRGSVINYSMRAGPHKLRASQDSSTRNVELEFNTIDGQLLALNTNLGVHSVPRAVLATLVPGSTQLLDGAYTKGAIMLLGSIALGVNLVMAQNGYINRLSQYDMAWQNYINAATEVEASRWHEDVQNRKADLDKYYARRTVSIAVFVAGYVYTVIDAFLNHLVVDEIEVAPLTQPPNTRFSSSLDPGVQVKVKL